MVNEIVINIKITIKIPVTIFEVVWNPNSLTKYITKSGKIDKKTKGGLGVMLDDMLAGLFAGLLSAVIYGFLLKFDLVFCDKDLINLFWIFA